jgi:hypothetical protein
LAAFGFLARAFLLLPASGRGLPSSESTSTCTAAALLVARLRLLLLLLLLLLLSMLLTDVPATCSSPATLCPAACFLALPRRCCLACAPSLGMLFRSCSGENMHRTTR